jgi:hypothetical protein
MNCRHVQQLLSNSLDGVVPEREAGAVAAHLRDCHACRRLRAEFLALEEEARQIEKLQPAPSAAARCQAIEQWMAERSASPPSGRRGFLALSLSPPAPRAWLAQAAAAGLVLLVALAWWTHGRVHEPSGIQTTQRPSPERIAPVLPAGRHSHPSQAADRIALGHLAPRAAPSAPQPSHRQPAAGSIAARGESHPSPHARPQPPMPSGGDVTRLHGDPLADAQQGVSMPAETWDAVERRVRHTVPVRDDFVLVPFPRLASTADRSIAEAVESYKHEAAVVDPRLSRAVTVQQKATALSDLCDHLRADTGIALTAGSSVADEKVTVFCEKRSLRDVMRQLSRPFGYTWLRTGKAAEYRYELVQDLRSQLLEEELRNRDRNEALLALERDIERYQPYMGLSPDEALAREKNAAPAEKRLLECLAKEGWGPIHMYYRLSRQDMETLRGGQELAFSIEPRAGERALPPDLERGVLQSMRDWRVIKFDNGYSVATDLADPRSQVLTAVPEVHAQIKMGMSQSELGQFTFWGLSGFFTPRNLEQNSTIINNSVDHPVAQGRSPATLKPENGAAHAGLAHDAALRGRITLQPQPTCRPAPPPDATDGSAPEPKVTTADVLEALHRASGLPIIADYYTRLYKPETVSVQNMPLFDALNHLTEAMRLRWNKDAGWLQFRSTSYYHDRLKEVPNRLLARWSAARRQQGMLPLDDLVEIAQLPDAQLDGADMAEGAENCFGFTEWMLLRDGSFRSHVRYLAQFTPAQRQEMMTAAGLPFTRMSLAQQQGFIARAFDNADGAGLQSLEEMAGATLRVDYTQPGRFQWKAVGDFSPRRWVVPIEPGPQGRRVLLPPVRERTREAALQTARRVYPRLSEAMVQEERRYDPLFDPAQVIRETDIHPTRLDLVIVYIPGLSNARPIRWWRVTQDLVGG